MARRWLKSMLTGGGEIVLSIGLVVAFFAIFLIALSVGFPKGTSLQALMTETDTPVTTGGPRGDLSLESDGGLVGTLTRTVRSVKQKPADNLLWSESREGMPLEDRHSVQTMSRSGARIAFDPHNEIELGENSMIVLRRLERERVTRAERTSMLVLEGDVEGRISADRRDTLRVEIETPSDSRIRPQPAEGTTAFAMSVTREGATTLSVHEGAAEVVGGGKTVVVGSNQAITVDEHGQLGRIWELPEPPGALSPEPEASFVYRSHPPRVEFAWQKRTEAGGYRLEIAKDPAFEEIVHVADVREPSFVHGNLHEGGYYWRVACLRDRARSIPSSAQRFRVVHDGNAPSLTVRFPEGTVRSDRLVLKGATEPGTRVFVVNRETEVTGSGEFERVVPLERGVNVVVVEAVDAAGNTAYQSQLVHAKY